MYAETTKHRHSSIQAWVLNRRGKLAQQGLRVLDVVGWHIRRAFVNIRG